MKIYCMSDIHGCLPEFEEALSLVEDYLKEPDTKLCLLGDYIHGGADSYGVLDKIMRLQDQYGTEKVIALMGNHEEHVLSGIATINQMTRTLEEEADEGNEKYIYWIENLPRYYTEGNTVRKRVVEAPQRETRQQELPSYAKVRRVKPNQGMALAMNPGFAVFLGLSVLITLAACVMMLSMQAKVTNQGNTITKLQAEIETLTDDNNAYEARINSSVNLEQIRDVAMNQLGMVYPTDGQVVYYDQTEADYVRQYQDVPEVK